MATAGAPQPQAQRAPTTRIPAPAIEPLAPDRYRVQFTGSAELREKLERLSALMRRSVPDGDLGTIIDAASSRHVPPAVRRAVHARDAGRCAYRDTKGRRCSARVMLELHHRHPYGYGGDHSVGNVALLCHAHNCFLEEIDYGNRSGSRSGSS